MFRIDKLFIHRRHGPYNVRSVIVLFFALNIYNFILRWSSGFSYSTDMVQPALQIGLYSNLLNYVIVKMEEYT
jgi:hypothetical protein